MRKWFAALLFTIIPLAASAAGGAELQEYFNASPVKVGFGKYYYKGVIHAYDATLYSTDGRYHDDQVFALELVYKTDIDGDEIADKSIEQMNKVAAINKASSDKWLAQMKAIFPDVDDGVSLTGVNIPGKGVIFLKNGVKIGEIDSSEFAKDFFGIWMSDKTPEPDLKAQLLGIMQ